MSRLLAAFVLSLLCSCTLCVKAQSPPHQHSPTTVIDGSLHPELIPDSLAYRLYFVAVSTRTNPSDAERTRQQTQLNMIGLTASDREALVTVLAVFRIEHDRLVAQYNQSAEEAASRNEVADVRVLLRQFDDLVRSARDTLKARLSPEGMTQFDAFVHSEKKNMRVSPEEQ